MPIALSATLLALASESVALRVSYDAPDGCPDRVAFYQAVQARTERVRPAVGDETALQLSIRVTGGEHGFHGELRNLGEPRESRARIVDGSTCKEVVEALSLTLALSLDPEAHPTEPVPAQPVPPMSPLPVTPVGTRPTVRTRLELGASALATWLDTSGVSTGGALSVGVLREVDDVARGSLELSLVFAQDDLPRAPADHRARFGGLTLAACPLRLHFRAMEFAPCALSTVGVLELSGRQLARAETVDRLWWSAGLEAKWQLLLGRGLLVQAALAGSVPFARHRYFTNDPANVVLETPVISTSLHAGIGYRF